MGKIGSKLGNLAIIGGLIDSLNFVYAQTAPVGSFNDDAAPVQTAQSDSIVSVVAEAQGLQLMSPDQVPPSGTFWTVLSGPGGGVGPPFPCPPLDPSLPIYAIADGQFLVDGTFGSQTSLNTPQAGRLAASSTSAAALEAQANAVLNLITQVQTASANRQMRTRARAMGMDVPSLGSDDSDYPTSYVAYAFDTNQLWLEITNVANGWTYLNLHNATNQVYAIWSITNLLTPFSGWRVETEVWPTNPAVMSFTIPVLARQNLFVRAENWTGVDSDGDGIPDWWIWKYFGDLSETATNRDANGNTLLSDYQNGLDPNVIQFDLSVTNNYVNSMSAAVQLNIICGAPGYVAVAVDDTNYAADANWQVYTGTNVAVTLGLAEGWHDVWIGLRGLLSNATQTWQWKRLKLDLTPPVLVITNPVVTTVSAPVIQLQGYSPEALDSISYDLTNALGLLTNQQVLIADQSYSTNTWEFTTNYFQCYDVPLTNGLNTITLHATDLAGNVTTTNFSFTLDYSGKTNPPLISLYWPPDGTLICNGSYTWRGRVDDPAATVTAQLVDTNGDTNIFSGIVERDGKFWVENLPLSSSTNYLTLTVTDAAGNVAVTNILVFPGAVGLTIDMPDASQLWNQGITVSGTISDEDGYTVWVNGVKAALNGDGTWTATNVFLPAGGTALIQARAIPNSNNGGNGTGRSGGGPVTYDNLGNPDPPADNDAESQADKPWGIYVLEDHQNLQSSSDDQNDSYGILKTTEEDSGVYNYDRSWQSGAGGGGSLSGSFYHFDSTSVFGTVSLACSGSFSWPASDQPDMMGTITESGDAIPVLGMNPGTWACWPPQIGWQHCNVKDPYTINTTWDELNGWVLTETDTETYQRKADTKIHLRAGGKAGSGRQSIFLVTAWASEILDKRYISEGMPSGGSMPPQNITINGHALGADGIRWLAVPDGGDVDVTPIVKNKDYYNFGVGAQKYTPYISVNHNAVQLDPDTVVDGATFCVGQLLPFELDGLPVFVNAVGKWTLPGKYVNEPWQLFTTDPVTGAESYFGSVNYRVNPDLLAITGQNLTTHCWYVNQPGGTVGVNANLHFSNGQYASVAAMGKISVFRPTAEITKVDRPFFFTLSYTNALTCMLELGNSSGDGAMSYWVTVHSQYYGNANITQLVTLGYSNPLYDFSDERCDGTGSYNVTPTIIFSNSTNSSPLHLDDGPYLIWEDPNTVSISARDFVQFCPQGGIPVTLGIVNWNANATARQDSMYETGSYRIPLFRDRPAPTLRMSFRSGRKLFIKKKILMHTYLRILFITALGFLALNSWAEQPPSCADEGVETKIVDGFFMGVSDLYGYTNTSPDRDLAFSIWTTNKIWATNNTRVTFPTKPEFAWQVELFDTNGVAVPKTAAGKNAGTKFLDFGLKTAVVRSTLGPEPNAQHWVAMEKSMSRGGLLLFRPSDFFKIEKPGKYTLRIRFQILTFPRTGPTSGDYTNNLIRFPPLDYTLVKK